MYEMHKTQDSAQGSPPMQQPLVQRRRAREQRPSSLNAPDVDPVAGSVSAGTKKRQPGPARPNHKRAGRRLVQCNCRDHLRGDLRL